MQDGYVIGVDAGGTKIAYGLFDSEFRLIDSMEFPTILRLMGLPSLMR